MKCTKCGASVEIENNFCPYCGTENQYFQKHREEMSSIKKDYEEVKDQVLEKHQKIAGFSVKIMIICIFVAVDILLFFLAGSMWDILRNYEKIQAKKRVTEYRQQLELYEEEKDYILLSAFYEENKLYGVEGFEDFEAVYRISSSYSYIYKYIIALGDGDIYFTDQEKIKYICDNLDYLYDYMKPKEYSDPEQFQGKHQELMEQITYDLKALFITYGGITEEEAEQFPQMSYGKRQIALERGLGYYED